MSGSQTIRKDYRSRINKVIDYIENNIDVKFSLSDLSIIANFSPYHFHRIFKIYTGETLNQFIARVRLEKAATALVLNKSKSITEIALETGFSGSAAFARAFKEYYKISASEYRSGVKPPNSKIRKTVSNSGKQENKKRKEFTMTTDYFGNKPFNQSWRIKMSGKKELTTNVEIREFKPFTVAYVRHVGPYAADEKLFNNLFERLFGWAGPRNLIKEDSKILSIYHDNPEITEEEKLRVSICLEVPSDTEVTGDIGKMELAGGKYAVGHFELTADDYGDAWQTMYAGWLPKSGYEPDDRPCFELMLNDPKSHPEGKHIVDICISVKPEN
ncbi:MAG: AraC family transcriptional regulator [Melioribacteraceae bacterium]|nr:MAG: AraC family transcriptional regulator [Melioribacteraceae bacterium]